LLLSTSAPNILNFGQLKYFWLVVTWAIVNGKSLNTDLSDLGSHAINFEHSQIAVMISTSPHSTICVSTSSSHYF
jgi:hypothetical protein